MTTITGHAPAEERVEQRVGNLLRFGVLLAAAVALVGGIAFLARHGGTRPDYGTFRSEPSSLHTLHGIITGALSLQTSAIVQFGIILLIATPIARVLLTLLAFALRRDWMYVLISAIVLGVLAYSLLVG